MRIAALADVDRIKNILLVSFRNDPHVTWLLEESKNKLKLKVLIDYVVHQTLQRGEIYLSDDNNAVTLWDFERHESMSFHYIWRNVAFLIQIGIKSVVRIVKSETQVHNSFRKHSRYCHLHMIGVLPEEQGKGLASALPEAQNRIRTVLERGLQRDAAFEKNWPEILGSLVETGRKAGRDGSQS